MNNLQYTSINFGGGLVVPHTASAEISDADRGQGTAANQRIHPPGWVSGLAPYYQHRGHLIAKSLGGSGQDWNNLVTLTDGTNVSLMAEMERIGREILDAHANQTFLYISEALYVPADYPASGNPLAVFPMPSRIRVSIRALDGALLYQHVWWNGVLLNHG